MKTFTQFIAEGPDEPKAKGEQDFKAAHTDATEKKDYPAPTEAAFKGNTTRHKRKADREDSDPKQE